MASLEQRLSDLIAVIGYDMKYVQLQLGDGAIVLDPWHKVDTAGEPVFKNSWVNTGVLNLAQFRKDPFGVVKLSGYVKSGAAGTVVFTLPVGYRPVDQVGFSCYCSGGSCLVTVDANGDVRVTAVTGAPTTLTSLDDVEFDTEAVSQIAALMGPKGDPGDQGLPGDKVMIPMDTWHKVGAVGEPAFTAYWQAAPVAAAQVPRFSKYPDGRVRLAGFAISLAALSFAGASSYVFTLPVGYRPKAVFNTVALVIDSDGSRSQVRLVIYDTGEVRLFEAMEGSAIAGGIGTWINLDNIEFDTETVTQFAVGPKGDPGTPGAQGVPGSSVQVPLDIWHRVGTAGEPAFLNSWVNFDATRGARFRKYPDGKVRIQGIIKTGATGTTAFTLPVGYRPTSTQTFPIISAASTGYVSIDSTGIVVPVTVGGNVSTYAYLDGIEFDTELVTQFAVGPQGPQGVQGVPGDSVQVPLGAWHHVGSAGEPGFSNGWANFGGLTQNLEFRKDPLGKVQVRGRVMNGTSGVIFTLPVGYRPPFNVQFTAPSNGVAGQSITVGSDGTVTSSFIAGAGTSNWIGLDLLEFDTDSVTQFAVGPKGDPGPSTVNTNANSYFATYDAAAPGMGYGDVLTTGRPDDDTYIFTSVETDDPDNSSPSGLMYVQTLIGVYSYKKMWRRIVVGNFVGTWSRINDVAARVVLNKNTVTNLANAVETSVAFNVDVEDDWGFHAGSDIWAIVPAGLGGMYMASFEVWYASNAVNARYTRLYRDRGGVVTTFASDIRQGSPGGVATIVHLDEPIDLQPGDKVWPSLYQNAGAGVTLVTPASTCQLKLVRIGNV